MALDIGELVGRLKIDGRQFDRGLDQGERQFRQFGGRLATLAAAAGVAVAVAFGAALVGAMGEQDVGAKIAAQLGQGAAEAERLGHLAGKIYAKNFGESISDVGDALSQVMRANLVPEDAGEAAIAKVTERALLLRDVFKQDLPRVINGTQQLLRNGLAPDAEGAFDLIVRGIQQGADKSEDLLDTLNEYSTQFRELGLTGEQALGLISQGLRAGARDSATVADTLKELAIRAQDASTSSAAGFATIGLNAAKMTKVFANGGPAAAKALDDVLDRLRAMPDRVKANEAAVQLFGTKAEDLQDSLYALDLTTAADNLGKVEGAAAKAAETMGSSAAANIESFKRQLEVTFVQTLGGVVLPAITNAASFLSDNFGPALKEVGGWIKRNREWLEPLAVTLATFGGILGVVTGAMKVWAIVTGIVTTAQTALSAAISANPIGIIILAIAALVAGLIYAYNHSETFRRVVDAAWAGIKTAIGAVVGWIQAYVWPAIQATWKGIAVTAMWLWRNVIKPVAAGIAAQIRFIAAVATWLWKNVISPVARGIGAAFTWVSQAVRAIAAIFIWLGRTVLGPLIAGWLWGFKQVGAIASWLWNTILKPTFTGIGIAAGWVWDKISVAFGFIMGIVRKVGDTFKSVFSAIGGWISGAFNKAVGVVKGVLNTLIDLVNKAVQFLNDKLIGGLNKIPGVDFPAIPKLPRLANAGTVHPRAGGRPVIMGDGGEVEYGIPHSAMEKIIAGAVRAAGGSSSGSIIEIIVMDEMRRVRKTVRAQGGRAETVLVGGSNL